MNNPHLARRQRGAAALATTVVLLLGMSIAVFYLNRGIIFEQRTSANQMRSTTALETAEAGLEWATGMLNMADDIGTNCNVDSTTNLSFRKKYAQTYWRTGATAPPLDLYDSVSAIVPARKTFPGCKISGTTLTCSCPDLSSGTLTVTDDGTTPGGTTNETTVVASLGTAVLPGFTVAFAPVPATYPPSGHLRQSDPEAVMVTVTGCTATSSACAPGITAGGNGPDSVATISAIIKLRPLLRAGPAAALTCGGSCAPGGSYNIINTDPSTNGVTINAGSTITTGNGVTTGTIPGVPPANAQVSGDSSLSSLSSADPTCANSSMFKAYFGSTIEQYAASTEVTTIPNCTNPSSCGAALMGYYNQGKRSFYFPDGVSLNNSSGIPAAGLGDQDHPVTLVTPASFDLNGNISIYGVVFSNDASTNDLGTGSANIYGGIVTCRNQQSNGNGTIAYDPKVMRGIRRDSATAVRVPGSWTDACKLSSASPPVRSCS